MMNRLSWISVTSGEWADASIARRARLWLVAGLTLVMAVAILI